MFPADPRIGVHEEEILALRGARACVPRGRDLASIDSKYFRATLRSNLRRRVCRRVINYDNFVRLRRAGSRGVNRDERRRELEFFVMCRDDE